MNQEWAGDAGRRIASKSTPSGTPTVTVPNCGSGRSCSVPRSLGYAKRLPVPSPNNGWGRSAAAVMLINNADSTATVSVDLSDVWLGPCTGSGCVVRDAVRQSDLPNVTAGVSAVLAPHASLLVVVTSSAPASERPPSPSPPSPPSPPPPGPANCKWIAGAGLRAADISHTASPTKEACCAACEADPRCVAACFRPPNHTGTGTKGCHMKASYTLDPGGAGDSDAVVCVPQSGAAVGDRAPISEDPAF